MLTFVFAVCFLLAKQFDVNDDNYMLLTFQLG
jgi:hypothetical protein